MAHKNPQPPVSRLKLVLAAFVLIASAFSAGASSVRAQGAAPSITPHHRDLQSQTSNDYWVAFPQNYDDETGKYIQLYLSSTDSTTAYVTCNGTTNAYPVAPGVTATVNIPLAWEMKGSNVVTQKAVHVWSNDAPLFVEYNSHNPYTSDASYILPTMGWGRAYVVASYSSLFEGFGTYVYDYPSEFVIISDQDSNLVTIVPSSNIRGANPTDTAHPAGVPFTVMLNAGDAVQYQCVKATDAEHYDLSGTLVQSSQPVGVLGASQCANIPMDYPYCDFVCEMLQPVRTWGQTYYTAPFSGVKTGQTFLVIGTTVNQTIYRNDGSGKIALTSLAKPYDTYWLTESAKAYRWESDAPFLLMQYSNSSTYPDQVNGQGDPFMMAVNAVDNFSTPVIFNVFSTQGNATMYKWYANIIAQSGLAVTVDGSSSGLHLIHDDGLYATYSTGELPPGQHIVASIGGVSVSAYGYGFDESVGFAGAIGVSSINSPDTLAPIIKPSSPNPYTLSIAASDKSPQMSGLGHVQIDAATNVQIKSKTIVEGGGNEAGSFDVVMADQTKPAHVALRIYDLAGNYTTVTKDFPAVGTAGVSNGRTSGEPAANTSGASASDSYTGALSEWLANGTGTFDLAAPSPMPASTNVTFNFALRSPERMTIDLYDLLGNKVLSVLNAFSMDAGVHSAQADVRLLPTGTYIYRAEIGSETLSGKLVIAR